MQSFQQEGGVKEYQKKNIKNFLGKPILAYSIDTAISSGLFDKIIVSTDSEEIAKIAISYGAETPFIRPKELADDYTGIHEVIGQAINLLEKQIKKIDFVCCIYPTAPLIQKNDILKGYELIKNEKWDSVIAATHYSYPVHRSFIKFPNGGLKMLFPEHFNSRSQDLPKVYHDAGQFFWAKTKKWQNPTKGFDQNNTIVEIPANRVQDIDTHEDWKKAELIYKTIS